MYTPNFTRRTYDELLRRAQVYLSGDSHACVVLDASYQSQQERNRLRQGLAGQCRLFFIHCTCPESTVKKDWPRGRLTPMRFPMAGGKFISTRRSVSCLPTNWNPVNW